MCQKMFDRFLNFLEFDIRRRMNMQILLRNVKKLACGTCIRICPLSQNENILKERLDGQFLIACPLGCEKNKCCCCSLRLALHENRRSKKLFCIKTLLEKVDTALYLRLHVNKLHLSETAVSELYLRLHPMNFT